MTQEYLIKKANFDGSPYIGIFCVANDNVALVPPNTSKNFLDSLKETLDVEPVRITMSNTTLVSIFCAMNNDKIFVPDILEKDELKILKDNFSDVIVLSEKYTAVGNLVALNDNGAACSRYIYNVLLKYIKSKKLTVANSDLVGSCVSVNNKGFLAHINSTEPELKELENIFNVPGDCGTVNFGDSFVKSGIVGNKRGILAGGLTSGPELNRIDDIFL